MLCETISFGLIIMISAETPCMKGRVGSASVWVSHLRLAFATSPAVRSSELQ